MEELSEEELEHLKSSYLKLAQAALKEMHAGKSDLGTPGTDREIRLATEG